VSFFFENILTFFGFQSKGKQKADRVSRIVDIAAIISEKIGTALFVSLNFIIAIVAAALMAAWEMLYGA